MQIKKSEQRKYAIYQLLLNQEAQIRLRGGSEDECTTYRRKLASAMGLGWKRCRYYLLLGLYEDAWLNARQLWAVAGFFGVEVEALMNFKPKSKEFWREFEDYQNKVTESKKNAKRKTASSSPSNAA